MEPLLAAALFALAVSLFLLWRVNLRADRYRSEQARLERQYRDLQEECAREHERLVALTSTNTDGLILLDAQGQITFMNDASKSIFDVSDGQAQRLGELGGVQDLQVLVDQVMQYGEPMGHTLLRGERAFAARVHPLRQDSNEGVLIRLNEITELQRLGRVRREFVANISHELRTPVTTLQLLADTFSPDTLKDQKFSLELIGKMHAQIDLLRQLTDELMDLALIESGQAPIKMVETPALQLMSEAAEPLRPQAERKGLSMTVEGAEDLVVLADPQGIRKVLGNMIHNAIKFTNPGGHIELHASAHGDNVEFAVKDSGCGIAEKDLPRIFERFYKADRSRVREQGELRGTGLGLAIAKHMVEAHGGKIWAESVKGKGSTFYFTLAAAN